jgi:hypothetical protein
MLMFVLMYGIKKAGVVTGNIKYNTNKAKRTNSREEIFFTEGNFMIIEYIMEVIFSF